MGKITKITKQTENRFLNLYVFDRENKLGEKGKYFVASRAEKPEELKANTREVKPDAVIIYSICEDKVVLVREYRYAIDDFIYEFPAGLVDPGESQETAAIREMKEETGLDFTPLKVDNAFSKPYFTTVGMTDEACGMAFGYARGSITKKYLEANEEIEVVLADQEEVKRILKEEKVSLMCSYMLMHYLQDEDAFGFLKEKL